MKLSLYKSIDIIYKAHFDVHITILYEKTARRDKQMGYDGVLQFKGTWRKYQARVLENANKYLMDQHVHIIL